MAFGDVWNRTLVYFGIAEEDDEWDEDGYVTEEELERTYSERPNVRRLTPRSRRAGVRRLDRSRAPTSSAPPSSGRRRRERRGEVAAMPVPTPVPSVRVHLVVPHSFSDAQQIADRFKDGIPVILNLQGADQELSEAPDRLHRAASRTPSTAGCSASPTRSSCSTPRNVEVSAEGACPPAREWRLLQSSVTLSVGRPPSKPNLAAWA